MASKRNSTSKPPQLALVIPRALIKKYEKEYDIKINQKYYSEGLKKHGIPHEQYGELYGGPTGVFRQTGLSTPTAPVTREINLYTKNLPSKFHTYQTLFHELGHAAGHAAETEATAFAEKIMEGKEEWNDKKKDKESIMMMLRQTRQYKKERDEKKKKKP